MVRPDHEIFEPANQIGRHLETRSLAPSVARIGHRDRRRLLIAGGSAPDRQRIYPDVRGGVRLIGHGLLFARFVHQPGNAARAHHQYQDDDQKLGHQHILTAQELVGERLDQTEQHRGDDGALHRAQSAA